jgi:hypothetical protein
MPVAWPKSETIFCRCRLVLSSAVGQCRLPRVMSQQPQSSPVPPPPVRPPRQKPAGATNLGLTTALAILSWLLGIGLTLGAIFGHETRHDKATHINELIYGPFFLLFAVVLTTVVYRTKNPARGHWQPEIVRDRWLRNPHQTYGIAAFLFFFAAVWSAFAVIGLEQRNESRANDIELCVFFGCLAAVFAWCGVRKLRAGILLSTELVVVRGMLRTWRMQPDEVTGFTPVLRGTACPLLHRGDRSSVPVFCLSRGTMARAGQIQLMADMGPICENLNAVLALVRGIDELPTAHSTLELTPKAQHANYRTTRVIVTAFSLTVIVLGIAAIMLARNIAASIAVVLVIGGNTLTCWVALRSHRKTLPFLAEPPGSPAN